MGRRKLYHVFVVDILFFLLKLQIFISFIFLYISELRRSRNMVESMCLQFCQKFRNPISVFPTFVTFRENL